jgi:hypothetical protein
MYVHLHNYNILTNLRVRGGAEEEDEKYRGNHTQPGQSEEAHHQPCPFLVVDDTRISDTRTHTHTHTQR